MKKLKYFIVFFAFSFHCISQELYIQFPVVSIEDTNVNSTFDNGYIITYYSSNCKVYFFLSKDNGKSWRRIESKTITSPKLHNGEIYFKNSRDIFKLNASSAKEELIYNLNSSKGSLLDFIILENGSFVLLTRDKLRLYDPNFHLIKEHNIELGWNANAVLVKGTNQKHILFDKKVNSMLTFNSDLTEVSSFIGVPETSSIQYSGNRIFLPTLFSDNDGVTWQSYPELNNGENQRLTVNKSRVLSFEDQNINISNDYGDSFEPLILDNQINVSTGWLHSSDGISFITEDKHLITTYDDGLTYNVQKMANVSVAYGIAANENGNVISSGKRYFSVDSIWSPFDIECNYKSIIALSNSTFISNPVICISEDSGISWSPNLDYYVGSSRQFIEKNEVLYTYYYKWMKSADFGETWQEFTYPNLENFDYVYNVTGEGNIILKSIGSPFFLNFKDGHEEIIIVGIGEKISEMFTAYNGPTTYATIQDSSNNYTFQISHSGYNNFQKIDLPEGIDYFSKFKVDFLNNVYFYNKHSAYISQDEGNTWLDISPTNQNVLELNQLEVGRDKHVYFSTIGAGVLKSKFKVTEINEIEVIVFIDENEDCQFNENNESLWEGIKVILNGNQLNESIITSPLIFRLLNDENMLEVCIDEEFYSICNIDSDIIFEEEQNHKTIYLPLTITKECAEIDINASTPLLRRCFDNRYTIEVLNRGTVKSDNIELDIILDDYFIFNSCNFPVLENDGKNIKIDLGEVERFDRKRVYIDFNLSCEAELGQAHYINANVSFDNSCSDNSISETFECRQNIGSYDPNDKTALVEGIANKEIVPIDEPIEYLVRFQNTGSDTAFTVRIEDKLSDALDISTFQAVSSSHDYTYEIDRKDLTFVFENILLPDSTTNEKESHGFIKFKIVPKKSSAPGQLFQNTADIFFDFNDPIQTNTTNNSFLCKHETVTLLDTICQGEESYGFEESGVYINEDYSFYGCDSQTVLKLTVLDETDIECSPTSSNDIYTKNSILVYPNPSSGKFHILSNNFNISKIKIFTINGNVIKSFEAVGNQSDIDLSEGLSYIQIVITIFITSLRSIDHFNIWLSNLLVFCSPHTYSLLSLHCE